MALDDVDDGDDINAVDPLATLGGDVGIDSHRFRDDAVDRLSRNTSRMANAPFAYIGSRPYQPSEACNQ